MLRRPPLLPLVLTAVVLIGCGNHQGAVAADPTSSDHSASTRPHVTATPKSHEAPTSAPPHLTGPLADVPLDLGYPEKNGDDDSPVEVTTKPATRKFGVCDRTVWDPRRGATDVIGVEYRGEAELVRGRTLVLYADAAAAAAALTATRAAVGACPDEPDGHGQGTTHTITDDSLGGDQSFVWTDTYYSVSNGEKLHDTGLVVYSAARVGRAVLLAYDYGEGNGTSASRAQAVARSTKAQRALVERMGEVAAG